MGPLRGVLWEVSMFVGQDSLVLGSLGIVTGFTTQEVSQRCASREPGWPHDYLGLGNYFWISVSSHIK